jgi:DNA-binding NtrC family response regulator
MGCVAALTHADIASARTTEKIPLRILFFEDQDDDIELSLLALKSSEFEVKLDVAKTPERFIEYVRANSYDVVLSDYRMPRVSGMDVFGIMRSAGVDIPFILVTGSLGDERAVECL